MYLQLILASESVCMGGRKRTFCCCPIVKVGVRSMSGCTHQMSIPVQESMKVAALQNEDLASHLAWVKYNLSEQKRYCSLIIVFYRCLKGLISVKRKGKSNWFFFLAGEGVLQPGTSIAKVLLVFRRTRTNCLVLPELLEVSSRDQSSNVAASGLGARSGIFSELDLSGVSYLSSHNSNRLGNSMDIREYAVVSCYLSLPSLGVQPKKSQTCSAFICLPAVSP